MLFPAKLVQQYPSLWVTYNLGLRGLKYTGSYCWLIRLCKGTLTPLGPCVYIIFTLPIGFWSIGSSAWKLVAHVSGTLPENNFEIDY